MLIEKRGYGASAIFPSLVKISYFLGIFYDRKMSLVVLNEFL
jgi:hypothetical protein